MKKRRHSQERSNLNQFGLEPAIQNAHHRRHNVTYLPLTSNTKERLYDFIVAHDP